VYNGSEAALIRELRVRETELEMRTEALRTTQWELEESKAKYANLFDLAPIGYFVLDERGQITDVNLAGVSLLQDDREKGEDLHDRGEIAGRGASKNCRNPRFSADQRVCGLFREAYRHIDVGAS